VNKNNKFQKTQSWL